ncbi:MAG: hypothetical protein NC210_04975, partial [[Clostridium] fimetarium]|nr:hypothetical protein [[Clostridium] fimetarium]
GDAVAFRRLGAAPALPKLEDGEFIRLERVFEESGMFSFTGSGSVTSADDVAYIFRSLEDYSVEHAFVALVKDGQARVVHLGMGTATASLVNEAAIRAAVDTFGADKVYFVHNHPSGILAASRQDRQCLARLEKMLEGEAAVEAIIIDTTSGRYSTFGNRLGDTEGEIKGDAAESVPTLSFTRQRYTDDYRKEELRTMGDSRAIAGFVSSQRLGSRGKVSYLILDRRLRVVGNLHTPYGNLSDASGLAREMAGAAVRFGGEAVIPYGNFDLAGVSTVVSEVKRVSGGQIRMLDAISVRNGLSSLSAYDEGLIGEPSEAYGAGRNDARYRMGDVSARFQERLATAVANRGTVMPGLKEATVKVVNVPKHTYEGHNIMNQAVDSASKRYAGKVLTYDNFGTQFEYIVKPRALKYAANHSGKSSNMGVHAAVMDKLSDVIGESIEVMEHADVNKVDGKRNEDNGYSPNSLMHRFVGAVNIDGTVYRVITTLKELSDDQSSRLHTYEVTKIEVLDADTPSTSNATTNSTHTLLGVANLLNGAEIHNKSGEKILDESGQNSPRVVGEALAGRLHTPVRFIEDVSEITDRDRETERKMRGANGWYDTATGEVVVVLPNCGNVADVEATIFHEVVGHKGLRELIGENDFRRFLGEVYDHAAPETKARIHALMSRNGWDAELATEEYIAQLAEKGFDDMEASEKSLWFKIREKVLEFLARLFDGRGLPASVSVGDNEIRYMLWRAYQRLTDGSLIGEAENALMRERLGLDCFRFSSSSDHVERGRALARHHYEFGVSTGAFQFTEAFQDSMLGLKRLYEAIERGTGEKRRIEDIPSFENAYLAENALSSLNQAEMDAYERLVMRPLLDAIARLAWNDRERERLTGYMMAKHGLERNAYMRQEAANKHEDTNRDFAGLVGLTGEPDWTAAETAAQRMVDEYERLHDKDDIDKLWARVNDATKATLSKVYESGILGKEQFDKISRMYEYYIPLRGWDETTSDDVYGYLTSRDGAFSSPVKKAGGRSSKADDPIATIANMAENAIIQGNRNRMKQRFLNYVLNHPSDLVSVNKLWVKYDEVADEWIPVFADIDPSDTPETIERTIADFEQKMEALRQAESDKYKCGRDAAAVPYKIVNGKLREHQVLVKRGGMDYVLTINGNPRAAQAVNGMTNPDNEMKGGIGDALKGAQWVNRQLSNLYTTRNPDFVVSNFIRDAFYSNSMVWIKESPRYALRFHRNFAKVNPAMMLRLLSMYREDSLDLTNPTHRMFHEFMMNGGETGYTMQKDVEEQKKAIRKALKKSRRGRVSAATAWDWLGEKLDDMNRGVENCARFAAYATSRESGRDVQRAVFDAKEISVNFNKKGAGAKFLDKEKQSWAMRQLLRSSDFGRVGFVFWNAAIQGTFNFAKNAGRHPAKTLAACASLFLLGALAAAMGGSGDDDNPNAYFNQPDYVRRSNLMFRFGNQWVAIPLPVEYRAIYGMGELFASVATGKEEMTDGELAKKITAQMSQVMPLDFMEGGGGWHAFIPSAVKSVWEAYVSEKGWTGMPLYKDTPYNKNMPEWTKAYKSANSQLVALSAWCNESSGGNDYLKGWADLNPAKVEYLLKGYFGGYANVADKLVKTGETIFGDREYDPRNVLLLNRVLKRGDERTAGKKLNEDFYRFKGEFEDTRHLLKSYEKERDNGSDRYGLLLEALNLSEQKRRHDIFDLYQSDIRDIETDLKQAGEAGKTEKVAEYEKELAATKRKIVNHLKAVGTDGEMTVEEIIRAEAAEADNSNS